MFATEIRWTDQRIAIVFVFMVYAVHSHFDLNTCRPQKSNFFGN